MPRKIPKPERENGKAKLKNVADTVDEIVDILNNLREVKKTVVGQRMQKADKSQ